MKKRLIFGTTLVIAAFAVAATLGVTGGKTGKNEVYAASRSLYQTASKGEELITGNVSIGGIDVGGMTVADATALINERTAAVQDAHFTLTAGEKSMQVTGLDLVLSWGNTQVIEEAANLGKSGNLLTRYKDKKDLEQSGKSYDIVYTIDDTEAAALLNASADMLSVKALNGGLVKTSDGFEITGGQNGVSVDVQASLDAIHDFISNQWTGGDAEVALATIVTTPTGSADDLSRVKDVLGSYHTDYSSSAAGRCQNIERAVSLINGTILYPGEEFSVANTIGPTDEANGYALAGAYENGQTVEAYGGGVCQVSTTLYNAVLFSELEVTVRSPHSMLVSYVEPSRDAAIAIDSGKDFRFANNTDAPIYIEGYTSNKQLYFNIYGEETRPANRTLTFESEVISETEPTTVFVATASPIGSISSQGGAHVGKNAELYKIVTVDGVEQSREKVNSSSYRMTPKTVAVGVSSLDPTASAAVSSAIASGNADLVYATVAAYSGAGAVVDPAAAQAAADAAAAQAQAAADAAAAQAAAEAAAILQ